MARTRKPPLQCALCGAARWNDESVLWLGPSWEDRKPYCADDCAKDIERQLLQEGI